MESYAPFAVCRDGCSRKHKGNDMFYCEGTNVPIQSGTDASGSGGHCNIMVNADGNPLWNNGGGYGLYMRFDCGNGIETRMAHLQGYNASTKSVINGRTGNAWNTPPHVHYEIYVNKKAVDPECALGVQNPKNKCPALGAGPPNLCDPSVVAKLHADAQSKLGATSSGTSMGTGGPSKPPDAFPSGVYGDPCTIVYKGVKQCSDPAKQCEKVETPKDTPADPPGHDMEDEGEYLVGEDTTDGTGLVYGKDGDEGDVGGDLTPGEKEPPADLPPLSPSEDGEARACALDTWVGMVNQSALEGRRETIMQRRFITKADSVIEYGCLPMYMKNTEGSAAAIFSESNAWVNRQVDIIGKIHTMNKTLGSMSMDSSLLNVVWGAHEKYKKNFDHPLLGGAEGYSEKPNAEQCKDMQKVWDIARCQNYPAPAEGFPRFEDLINNDPRKFPSNMACNSTAITQNMIDAAKNKAAKFDKVAPKLDYLLADKDCKEPVPTGLTIYRNEKAKGDIPATKTYTDGICTNAGCRYDNPEMAGAGSCLKN